MKTLELARNRKTSRSFKKTDVSPDLIRTTIDVAREAPSGANYQGWKFTVITNQDTKKRIREASEGGEKEFYGKVSGDWGQWLNRSKINWMKPYLEEAPVLIAVFARNDVPYSKESVWLAVGYMLLALEEQGLATVTYTPSSVKLVEDVLSVPEGYRLEVILPIGYSNDAKSKEPRLGIEAVLETIS